MHEVHDLSQRFLAALNPSGRRPSAIDDEEYAEFLLRVIRAWERRVIENPEMLAAHRVIIDRAGEIADVAIAINAARFAVDPRMGVSMLGCARIVGMAKSEASRSRARGVAIMGERVDRAGAAQFAEAKREREAIDAARADAAAVVELDAWRARRSA